MTDRISIPLLDMPCERCQRVPRGGITRMRKPGAVEKWLCQDCIFDVDVLKYSGLEEAKNEPL